MGVHRELNTWCNESCRVLRESDAERRLQESWILSWASKVGTPICRRESFPEWLMAWKHPRSQMKNTVRCIATNTDYIICNFYGTFVPSLWMPTASF